jgi:GR25 family glycosyltransferase involved in LPS biosynthesis
MKTYLEQFVYQIHHIDGEDVNRNNLVKYSHDVLSSDIDFLYSETISIYNENDLQSFSKKFPYFKINGHTHNFRYPEIGLWASTYVALSKFLNTDYSYIILFEDDCRPANDFLNLLDKYFKEVPKDWECFVLYNVGREPTDMHPTDHYEIGLENICICYQIWSTASIMFNRESALKIINYIENFGISLPLDIFLFYKQIKGIGADVKNEYCLDDYYIKSYTVKLERPQLAFLTPLETQIQNSDRINRLSI